MSEISDRYRDLATGFSSRVEAVPPARWGNPSPCADWTALDVVGHMVGNCERFFGMVGGELPEAPGVDDDPVGAWASARDAMQAGLEDPAFATKEYEGRFGRSTFEQAVSRFIFLDLIVHTWDLARATGGDEQLDPDSVHELFEQLMPADDMLRSPGVMGPKLEPPDGADEQTRLLAFLGRKAW